MWLGGGGGVLQVLTASADDQADGHERLLGLCARGMVGMRPLAGAPGSCPAKVLLLLLLLLNRCAGAALVGHCEPAGAPQWSYTTGGAVRSSPAVGANGTVIAAIGR